MVSTDGKLTPPRVHGRQTGFVSIRDFDAGVVRTLGGELLQDDPAIREYVVQIKQLPEGNDYVPIIGKKNPEGTHLLDRLPRIVVSRDSWEPSKERLHPGTEEYRIGVRDAISVQGPADPQGDLLDGNTHYETKEQADPFDITYTIECWHRYENWVQPILYHVMRTFRLQGSVTLTDSRNEERTYNIFMESGPTDLTEILSLTDRGVGYSVTFRVQGELDYADEITRPAMLYPNVTMTPNVEGS